MKRQPALTLIELVVVIGVMAILGIAGVISISGFRNKQSLRVSVEGFTNNLRSARVFAREEKGKVGWGVRYVSSNSYSLVSGTPSSFSVKSIYYLDGPVTFEGSFSDVWFGQATGQVSSPTSIELVAVDGKTATVEVTSVGLIKYTSL